MRAILYTQTPRFDPKAWLSGGERFPDGAQVILFAAGKHRPLIDGYYATADPHVSFDGRRVAFSGKRARHDSWQVWERPISGGAPVQVTRGTQECIRPIYMPGGGFIFARKHDREFHLATVTAPGREPERISYVPGSVAPLQVLSDGRVLFEGAHPAGTGGLVELYTVYSDGSGVESVRCDHGREHRDAHQLSSGDLAFAAGDGLARFTSTDTRAVAFPSSAVEIGSPIAVEIGSPIAEAAPGRWLASLRTPGTETFRIYEWPGSTAPLFSSARHAVQPALLRARKVPPRHPSALHNREDATLLCLNAYESPIAIAAGAIARVRIYGKGPSEDAALLGESLVESDGSFYMRVPADRPIRMEMIGRSGERLAGEAGWFWLRRGEQRVCVGCHAGPERAPENAVPRILTHITGAAR